MPVLHIPPLPFDAARLARAFAALEEQGFQPPDEKARAQASRMWQEAAGWWRRYLDNYPDLRDHFKDRDHHAAELMERCNESANLSPRQS